MVIPQENYDNQGSDMTTNYIKRESFSGPRSLDDYLEAAAASSSTIFNASEDILCQRCTHKRRNPPMRNSVFLRYSNGNNSTSDENDITNTSRIASVDSSSNKKKYPFRYWLLYLSLGVANSSDASEILCLSYILSVPQFDDHILHHTAWRAGLLAATVFMGMLLGGLFVGGAGDTLGRQPLLVAGLALNSVAGLVSAAATNVYILSICRFIAGIGIGATVPPLFALCSELAPPSSRGFWVTCVASFWMVGSMYVAIVGWILLGLTTNADANVDDSVSWWRIFTALCAIPSCLGCIMVHSFVPESPRFLLLQGQHDRALSVALSVADYMHYTGTPLTSDELVYHYPIEDLPSQSMADFIIPTNSREHISVRPLSMENNDVQSPIRESTYQRRSRVLRRASLSMRRTQSALCTAVSEFISGVSKLYSHELHSTTWPLQMVWFTLSFGSYGLMTWINKLFVEAHLENVYFNALLFSASNLPGNLLSALLMDKIGRASLLTGSILMASLSLVAFAYVAAHQSSKDDMQQGSISTSWIVLAACSFQCFTIASWNTIDVLSSELFPTSVRSTGMGVCAATGRVGAMIAQFVNGALVSHPVRLLLTAAGALFIGALTPVFLPADQTGRPVQDYTSDNRMSNQISPSSNSGRFEIDDHNDSNTSLPNRGKGYSRVPQSVEKQPVTINV
jgi:MFS transporter, VNT family, synaptic vesicle glycoprotein 2